MIIVNQQIQKKKKYALAPLLFALVLSGCTSPMVQTTPRQTLTHTTTATTHEKPTADKMARYKQTMRSVASGIKDDPQYRRIALDTPEKKEWFRTLTYRLWDRQITRQQFMAEGLAEYPTHEHEFAFIIKGFESACQ